MHESNGGGRPVHLREIGEILTVERGSASRGIQLGHLLELNEQLVLDHLGARGRTTRPELTAALGLSAATVGRIIRRLLDRGVVREEPGKSTGGRPRTSIVINPMSGGVIGIDLGGTRCHGILADLAGATLAEDERAIADEGTPFGTLLAAIDHLASRPELADTPLVGLAVGIPAVVDRATGEAIGGHHVHWQRFPLVSELQRHVDVPFVVENDINLGALGHAWRGDARGRSDFVVLSLGTGIGAGIVVDGKLVKGHSNAAGAVGRMVLERSMLLAHLAGGAGSLEALASGAGLDELARRVAEAGGWQSEWRQDGAGVGAREIIAAAADGDQFAAGIVTAVSDHVAMAIIAIACVVDPELVILDGAVGRALEGTVARIRSLLAGHLLVPPQVTVSSLGGKATVMGAIAAALQISRARRPRRQPLP
jgi:predicted NBD/HSP70 family sugar kinase